MAETFMAAMTGSDILQRGKCISLIGTLFEMHHLWIDNGATWLFSECVNVGVCVCVWVCERLSGQRAGVCLQWRVCGAFVCEESVCCKANYLCVKCPKVPRLHLCEQCVQHSLHNAVSLTYVNN